MWQALYEGLYKTICSWTINMFIGININKLILNLQVHVFLWKH